MYFRSVSQKCLNRRRWIRTLFQSFWNLFAHSFGGHFIRRLCTTAVLWNWNLKRTNVEHICAPMTIVRKSVLCVTLCHASRVCHQCTRHDVLCMEYVVCACIIPISVGAVLCGWWLRAAYQGSDGIVSMCGTYTHTPPGIVTTLFAPRGQRTA